MKKKQLFSLRKKKIGLCSVILGMAIIGGAPMVAHADSVDATTNPITELVATSGGDNTSTPAEANTVVPTASAPLLNLLRHRQLLQQILSNHLTLSF